MKYILAAISCIIMLTAINAPSLAKPSQKATTPKQNSPRQCVALLRDYEDASKDLAWNYVTKSDNASSQRMSSVLDYSAVTHAQLVVSQMKKARCPIPKYAPSATRYMVSAHLCHSDKMFAQMQEQMRGATPSEYVYPRCDRSQWTASPR